MPGYPSAEQPPLLQERISYSPSAVAKGSLEVCNLRNSLIRTLTADLSIFIHTNVVPIMVHNTVHAELHLFLVQTPIQFRIVNRTGHDLPFVSGK